MASVVVPLQQAVDERAAAAFDQGVGVPQLQQPIPEVPTRKAAGVAAYVLQRNSWWAKNDRMNLSRYGR